MDIMKKLASPPKENKSAPFWSINDKLEPEMLKHQIDEMKRMKMGGFFYHARGGYKGEYLGEDWMESVGVAVEHASATGMDAWIYDEAGWPSGFAGGLVNGLGDKYHQRWIKPVIQKKKDIKNERLVGVFSKEPSGGFNRVDMETLEDSEEYYAVYDFSTKMYVDVLSPDVTAEFIKTTYQKYYDLFTEQMGKAIPGIFTDEPQYARSRTPWSYVIPEEFKKTYGYDILDNLMALFNEYEGAQKVRYDFYGLCHRLFVQNYMKQLYDWCETHNCQLTGHILLEDSIATEMEAVAGSMSFYEYMHAPGIDWLGRTAAATVPCKQLQSAANQLDKKQTLSEMYGCSGWDVSFDKLKWIAESQYVNGINFMCQHLESYTIRGQRKRDFPPSLFHQQSWWNIYPQFNEYFNRLSALLTAGAQGVDVLLLHPIQTGWMLYNSEDQTSVRKFSATFDEISEKLGAYQVDYHYGDEIVMERHASLTGKKMTVGKCEYSTVVIPQMLTLSESTFNLLSDYSAAGGRLVCFKSFPGCINGKKDDRLLELKKKVTCYETYEELAGYLKSVSENCMYISAGNKNPEGIRYMKRCLGDNQTAYYLLNKSTEAEYGTVIDLKAAEKVCLLDLETLKICSIPAEKTSDGCRIELNFKPMQSRVLLCNYSGDVPVEKDNEKTAAAVVTIRPDADKGWSLEETGLNSLTVDYCSYRVDKGEWIGPVQTHLAFKQLLEYRRSVDIDVKMSFTMDVEPSMLSCLQLVCEDPQKWEISVNGSKISYMGEGIWKDSAFSRIDIKDYVKKGENEILISGNFYQRQKIYDVIFGDRTVRTEINRITYDTELESIYIIGDFGVRSLSDYRDGGNNSIVTDGPFIITERPKQVKAGDITTQGFCFFAETVCLSQNFNVKKDGKRIMFDMPTPSAPASEVYINGRFAGNSFWRYEPIDITDLVKDGENKLSVKLYSSNRNLLGPHHHIDGEVLWVGPFSFTQMRNWNDEQNTWTDSYAFVKFGI